MLPSYLYSISIYLSSSISNNYNYFDILINYYFTYFY